VLALYTVWMQSIVQLTNVDQAEIDDIVVDCEDLVEDGFAELEGGIVSDHWAWRAI